jgi:hypothetical protein
LGYSLPPEEQIKVNVTYVSRFYRRLPEHLQHALSTANCLPSSVRTLRIGASGRYWVKKAIAGL